MDITKDIQAMTTFRNHSAKFLRHLRKTKRALVLTMNGKAAAVVQDAEAYQHLLDLAAEASAAEGIRQGLEDVANGRTRPAREVLDEIRADAPVDPSLLLNTPPGGSKFAGHSTDSMSVLSKSQPLNNNGSPRIFAKA